MTFTTQFFIFLKSVPDVIWSGLIASILTLSGVLLSNWSNTKRLKIQLEHDRKIKEIERMTQMRREIYLRLTEEYYKATNHINAIPSIDPSTTDLMAGFNGFFSVAAQAQLVSKEETAHALGDITYKLHVIVMDAIVRATPIHNIQIDISISSNSYEINRSHVERALSEMRAINESAVVDNDKFSLLKDTFDYYQGETEKLAEERNRSYESRNSLQRKYVLETLERMKELNELQIRAFVMLRRELGLESNVDALIENSKGKSAAVDRNLREFLEKIDRSSEPAES